MNLSEKVKQVFEFGHSIIFQNVVKRIDGEWESRITWAHVGLPGNRFIKGCDWEGFEEFEDCVDDCLQYLKTLTNQK